MGIPTRKAKAAQVREFLKLQNIPFDEGANHLSLVAKLTKAGFDEIDLPDDPTAIGQSEPVQAAKTKPGQKMYKIRIHNAPDGQSNQPVTVGVNTKIMVMPRGEEIEIPGPYLEALNNAVITRYSTRQDGNGGLVMEAREEHHYPYSLVG